MTDVLDARISEHIAMLRRMKRSLRVGLTTWVLSPRRRLVMQCVSRVALTGSQHAADSWQRVLRRRRVLLDFAGRPNRATHGRRRRQRGRTRAESTEVAVNAAVVMSAGHHADGTADRLLPRTIAGSAPGCTA